MNTENHPHSNHSQLLLDLNPNLHQRIELAATERGLSLKDYIEEVLERTVPLYRNVPQQRRPISQEAFLGLLALREQIKQNHPGQVFDDSTEMIRQMREERARYLADL